MRRGLIFGLLGFACSDAAAPPAQPERDASDSSSGAGGAMLDGSGASAGSGGSGGQLGSGGVDAADSAPDDADAVADAAGDVRPCTPPDAADTVPSRYCAAIAALPCGQGFEVEACTRDMETFLDTLEAQGCACAFLAQLACGVEHGLICPTDFDDVRFDPACTQVEDDAQRCMKQGDNCSKLNVAGGGCDIPCDQYAARCVASDRGLDCTCTYGPQSGKRFAPASCDEATVATECR